MTRRGRRTSLIGASIVDARPTGPARLLHAARVRGEHGAAIPPYWKGWNPPIARRWFGGHKTVLGAAAGVGSAVLVAWLQSRIAWDGALVEPDAWVGLRLGAGAMAGDSVKSFVKRRVGIAPGAPWIPFDQLDFAVGALLLTWSRVSLTWIDVAVILAVTAGGHILVNHLGYWLGIRDTRW